ncbi:helix-turn-helix transcriptional regulator [Paracoccus shandongensis]|uniref:helix-turn-helix transcriptional regulator n=1 Tax=Paracoccus shandongensis TaxID=2816048 RepID=UPI001A8EC713|nr:LuxR C-terminal-related transcriptional regulator [Paracoccus shandongensis]
MPNPALPEDPLIAHLHRAALDRGGWHDFVLALEQRFGGAKASIHGAAGSSDAPFLSVAGSFDPAFAQSYLAYYHRINPFMPLSAALPQGGARVSPMDLPEEALRRTEFYNDWLRPQDDLSIAVAVKSRSHGNRSLVLSLNIRRRDGDRAALRAQHLLDRLEPHLSHAFQVAEIVSALSLQSGQAGAGDGGLMMVDDGLSLVWADAGAALQEGRVFRLDPFNRLMFLNGAVQDWARAACRTSGGAKPLARAVQAADGWQVRLVLPGDGPGLPSPFFGGHCFARPRILFVLSRLVEVPSRLLHLQSRFGLTPAEAEVAAAIAQGLTTAEIALARQASLHTVRNQIRSVLAKMDARHRIDVARILAQGCA